MIRQLPRRRTPLHLLWPMAVLTACGGSAPTTPPPGSNVAGVTGVTITTTATAIDVGATLQMAAVVAPTAAVQTVTWTSSDPSLATISGSGLVTALAPGLVTITATSTASPSHSATRQLQITCPAPRIVSANITANTTWQNWIASSQCFDYHVTSNVDVTNALLTIEPGTIVGFSGVYLRINSSAGLIAAGTAQNPIRLTRSTPQATWRSLTLRSSNPANRIEHVTIEHAGVNSVDGQGQQANLILTENTQTSLISVTSQESAGYGLYMRFGTVIAGGAATGVVLTKNAKGPAYLYASVAHFILGAQGANLAGNPANLVDIHPDEIDAVGVWNPTGTLIYRILQLSDRNAFRITGQLTLTAGVALAFSEDMAMHVSGGGSLRTTGTTQNPVILTGTTLVPGHWRGLVLVDTQTELDGVIISFAGRGGVSLTQPAALMLTTGAGTGTRLRMRNSILRQSAGYGIYARHVGVSIEEFTNNTLTMNAAGPGYVAANHVDKLDASSSFAGNAVDRLTVYFETVSLDGNATWEDLGVPFSMVPGGAAAGTFIVTGLALTIKEGVEMLFSAGAGFQFRLGAVLTVQGTQQNPVRISGADGARWRGIHIHNASAAFEHVHIEDGGSSAWNIITRPANVTVTATAGNPTQATFGSGVSNANATFGVSFDLGPATAKGCSAMSPVHIPPPHTFPDHCH